MTLVSVPPYSLEAAMVQVVWQWGDWENVVGISEENVVLVVLCFDLGVGGSTR